ncbi:MAG: SUMF1/EgtB/PvdO family nonheme iron enzyme [Xenococcus sp. (in: cyanobacteria)]
MAQDTQGADILKLMPILIYLRNERAKIAEDGSLSLSKLVTEQEEIKNLHLTETWFEKQLKQDECLVMLDGLDEVADEKQRKQVRDWVQKQIQDYPKAKFIITSRPFGYKSAQLEGVDVLEVLPFTIRQVEEFIDNWYLQNEIRRNQGKDDWGIRREAKNKAQDLMERIQRTASIASMATNPLLLTMIAVVHDYRGALPGRRVELYAEICDVLLGRRQEAKKIPDSLTPAQKQSILQVLALELMIRNTREFNKSLGVDIIRNELLKVAGTNLSPENFLKLIRDVSALLVETEQGILEFAHKSFQEYLAAVQIKENGQDNILTSNIDDSWWDETIRLYAAQSDATNLITAALEKNTVSALKLALDCTEEGLRIEPEVRQQLEDKLETGLESADAAIFDLAAEVLLAKRLSQFLRIDEKQEIDNNYITSAEYQLFLGESQHNRREQLPLANPKQPRIVTSWQEGLEFCFWLTDKMNSNLAGQARPQEKYYYRLPTITEVQNYPVKEHQNLTCWNLGEKTVTSNALRIIRTKSPAIYGFEVITVNSQGQETQKERCYAQYITENLTSDISLEMVYIPGGKFMMGSPEGEGGDDEKPQHEVTVQPFFLGKYPITQAQYQQVMGDNPSSFKGNDRPVENVSWDNAVEFCRRLSQQTVTEYRLPTEAEWEYACRAGTNTAFHFGATITDKLANYDANKTYADEPKGKYRAETTSIGSFPPNAFGLYDMHGNVFEWCEDDWHRNHENVPTDGSARVSIISKKKVVRGGSWYDYPAYSRSAFRYGFTRDNRILGIGFRVVCIAPRAT